MYYILEEWSMECVQGDSVGPQEGTLQTQPHSLSEMTLSLVLSPQPLPHSSSAPYTHTHTHYETLEGVFIEVNRGVPQLESNRMCGVLLLVVAHPLAKGDSLSQPKIRPMKRVFPYFFGSLT